MTALARWVIGLLPAKAWLALAVLALVAGAGWLGASTITDQAARISALEAEVANKRAAIQELGDQLGDQQQRHARELAARDAALVAERAHAQAAKARARTLTHQIDEARNADDAVDACMGMALPAGIADSLRQ